MHCTFKNGNAVRVCLHEYIFEKNRPSSEKLRFNLVFPVMPDKVAFERITLITAVTGKPIYLPLQKTNLHLQVCGKHWCLSANITKSMLQNCFEKVLKFRPMY